MASAGWSSRSRLWHCPSFLGREAELGTLEKNKIADLVLLDANPLSDIGNTRRIQGVVLAGRYFSRRDLDRMLNRAAAAAAVSH